MYYRNKNNLNNKTKAVNVNVNKPKSPQKPATNGNKRNRSSSSNSETPSLQKCLERVNKKLLKPTEPPDENIAEESQSNYCSNSHFS